MRIQIRSRGTDFKLITLYRILAGTAIRTRNATDRKKTKEKSGRTKSERRKGSGRRSGAKRRNARSGKNGKSRRTTRLNQNPNRPLLISLAPPSRSMKLKKKTRRGKWTRKGIRNRRRKASKRWLRRWRKERPLVAAERLEAIGPKAEVEER
jgi:ribosomal protein L19E